MDRLLGILGFVLVCSLPLASQTAEFPRANPALPAVRVPPDNPQTDAKVALGSQLFVDPAFRQCLSQYLPTPPTGDDYG